MLEGVHANHATQATYDGFLAYGELFQICDAIIEEYKGTGLEEHPFYPTAKEFIVSHPLHYEDVTNFHLYMYMLSGDFLEYRSRQYLRVECKQKFDRQFDIVEINRLFHKIKDSTHDLSIIPKLNRYIWELFLFIPIARAYAAGFQDHIGQLLTNRDIRTGKCLFQLLYEQEYFYKKDTGTE